MQVDPEVLQLGVLHNRTCGAGCELCSLTLPDTASLSIASLSPITLGNSGRCLAYNTTTTTVMAWASWCWAAVAAANRKKQAAQQPMAACRTPGAHPISTLPVQMVPAAVQAKTSPRRVHVHTPVKATKALKAGTHQ
jgi:hypothetical protein